MSEVYYNEITDKIYIVSKDDKDFKTEFLVEGFDYYIIVELVSAEPWDVEPNVILLGDL